MASQSQGVQQLLAAEKKAAEKVAEARKRECLRAFHCGFGVIKEMVVWGLIGEIWVLY